MVTDQVRRMQEALRECGFKRGDFTVRAERTIRQRDGRRTTTFGRAHANTRWADREIAALAVEHRHEIAAKGYGVLVYEGDEGVSFVTVHDLHYQEEPYIVRRAHNDGQYVERVAKTRETA